jgi:hypothetical protein
MAKKRTINLMISEEADTRLRALSAELKLAMGAIIEQAIMQWNPDTATAIESASITDTIEARFNALETRLLALEGERAVRTWAVERETVDAASEIEPGAVQEADMPTGAVSTSCEDAVAPTVNVSDSAAVVDMEADPVDHDAANQNDVMVESSPAMESDVVINQNKAAFDAAVIAAYKSGITKGADILRHVTVQGYRNSEGNAYYRSGVENTLKRAGLKD